MNKDEVIALIKRNKFTRRKAVTLISDFLAISKGHAEVFYNIEIIGVDEAEAKSAIKNGQKTYLSAEDEQMIRDLYKRDVPKYKLLKNFQISRQRLESVLCSETDATIAE